MAQVDGTLTLRGTSGPVSVQLEAMPVRIDPGGGHRYAYPEFGPEFIDAVFDGLLTARSGPPWNRRTVCRVCGSSVFGVEQPADIELNIRLADLPSFTVRFQLPAVGCASCGAWQARATRQLEADVSQALVDAFNAGNLRPG